MNIKIENKLLEHRDDLLHEMYGLDEFLACSIKSYEFMIDFSITRKFEGVVDIGCAFGFQSELCKDKLNYIGVNDDLLNFWKPFQNVDYIVKEYPFKDDHYERFEKGYLAISNLCLGWNCYAYEKDTYDKQFKALSEDFEACLLYMPIERKELLEKYFKNVEIVKKEESKICPTAFFYCFN